MGLRGHFFAEQEPAKKKEPSQRKTKKKKKKLKQKKKRRRKKKTKNDKTKKHKSSNPANLGEMNRVWICFYPLPSLGPSKPQGIGGS